MPSVAARSSCLPRAPVAPVSTAPARDRDGRAGRRQPKQVRGRPGEDYGRGAVLRQNPHDVLKEIELLVRRGNNRFLPFVGLALGLDRAVAGEHFVALLAAERRIGQYIVPFATGIGGERVGAYDWAFVLSDAVQVEESSARRRPLCFPKSQYSASGYWRRLPMICAA